MVLSAFEAKMPKTGLFNTKRFLWKTIKAQKHAILQRTSVQFFKTRKNPQLLHNTSWH